jgi:hypothetical protein
MKAVLLYCICREIVQSFLDKTNYRHVNMCLTLYFDMILNYNNNKNFYILSSIHLLLSFGCIILSFILSLCMFSSEPFVSHAPKYFGMYFLRTKSFCLETTGKFLDSGNLTVTVQFRFKFHPLS